MRQSFLFALFLTLLLASCEPHQPFDQTRGGPAPVSTSNAIPTATIPAHAPEIRFALIGEPRNVNVWELFDETGASYEDYALRAEYWPRLYHLAPPEFTFQSLAADGMPSSVIQDGGFYSAAVKLRSDLKWTDGSPFTAADVAFTVDTALAFELGFDWGAYYSGNYLSRLEVVDASTVKFIFKQKPDVAVWQYGALQGPVVQKAYWEPLTKEAAGLLPDAALRAQVEGARAYLIKIQANVNNLTAQANALRLSGQSNRKLEVSLIGSQNELIFAQNSLNKLLEDYNVKMRAAREVLYAVEDNNEPTLGTWIPSGRQDGAWVNEANPDFPFIHPNFDRAVYTVFADEAIALTALENNKVDAILTPNGLSRNPAIGQIENNPSLTIFNNEASSKSFISINPSRAILADPVFRQAIYCAVNRGVVARVLIAWPFESFVPSGNGGWSNPDAVVHCGDGFDRTKIVEILKSAGYSWVKEPTAQETGDGLILPDGTPFPTITLLMPSDEFDGFGVEAVHFIETDIRDLGIPLTAQLASADDIRYAVFSSKKYDMAILSWRLGLYPGYLCKWFGAGGQFDYGSEGLKSECEALEGESDLAPAQKDVFEIQTILAQDLPFIPLYADVRYDAYRNIRYPFESVLGGLGGLYGAPSHAVPVQ